jgi:methyltransferase (TIGR00027 family)
MRTGKASKTALRVAIRRAAHQLEDPPPVLADPIVVRLIGDQYARDLERARHKVARDFRAYMSARSRYAEDHLAQAVAAGVEQFVVLGAGLDTFAYRNPYGHLRVFEVDYPATQEWKRGLLGTKGIAEPGNLTYVPLDFERCTLGAGLAEAGFDAGRPAFFSWLGVAPYLTAEAFHATLRTIAAMPAGSGVTFDYAFAPETLEPARRAIFDRLQNRLIEAGEPLRLFFSQEEVEQELVKAGFGRTEHADPARLNELYFRDRADGLKLSPIRVGMLATAWVEKQGTGRRE